MIRRGTSDAPEVTEGTEVLDAPVEDLDAPGPEPAAERPRSRQVTAIGVLVLALVAATATAVHVRNSAQAEQDALLRQLSLQAGSISIADVGTLAADGTTHVGVTVPLVNRGPRTVVVTVHGITGAHQHAVGDPRRATVLPGREVTAVFDIAVDCAVVPGLTEAPTTPEAVTVRTTVEVLAPQGGAPLGGAPRKTQAAVRLPTPQAGSGSGEDQDGATSQFGVQVMEDGTAVPDLATYSQDAAPGQWSSPQAWLLRQIAVRCR